MEINKNLNKLASELLADIISKNFNNVIPVEGQLTDDGFRYSFKLDESVKLSTNNFGKIKSLMQKRFSANPKITHQNISSQEAPNLFKNNKYKLDLIKNLNNKSISIIKIGNDFVDLCDNLNLEKLPNPMFIELTNVSANHYNNEQLIAVDGWAVNNKQEFDSYKKFLEEKSLRDHRKIGADLELFCFDKRIGQGLPIWLENGTNIKFVIEDYCRKLLQENGYKFVQTPVLGTVDLYKISGHWDHYRENMFSTIKMDNEELVLKPMSCPHHIVTYQQKSHSYRELPYRIAEFGIQHRYEASGGLTGLERVRQMQLVDTHTILMHEQIKSEIKCVYNVINQAHNTLGTNIYSVELSLHDPKDKEKFFDNPKMWENAEKQLRAALKSLKIPFKEVVGEAAFYGPKIDMQIKTVLGHIITVSTIQLDFLLPERFQLEYINKEGKRERPVFIHAGIIGTFERYIAILLEQTMGKLPLWLSPIQALIIPIDEQTHGKLASKMANKLVKLGFRAKVDFSEERLAKKIRNAQIKKIPYQIILGDEELKSNNISYREYGKEEIHKASLSEFVKLLKKTELNNINNQWLLKK